MAEILDFQVQGNFLVAMLASFLVLVMIWLPGMGNDGARLSPWSGFGPRSVGGCSSSAGAERAAKDSTAS